LTLTEMVETESEAFGVSASTGNAANAKIRNAATNLE